MIIVGDDWVEGRHDIELMSEGGDTLARFQIPENVEGLDELLVNVGERSTEGDDVTVGIERHNRPWVTALRGCGFLVRNQPAAVRTMPGAVLPRRSQARHRRRHVLADMVRTERRQLRPVAEDSVEVEGLKILARTQKALIWERNGHLNRLRYNLIRHSIGFTLTETMAEKITLIAKRIVQQPCCAMALRNPAVWYAYPKAHSGRDKSVGLATMVSSPSKQCPTMYRAREMCSVYVTTMTRCH